MIGRTRFEPFQSMNAVLSATQTSANTAIVQNSDAGEVRVQREQADRGEADDERRDELEGHIEQEVVLPEPPVGLAEEERHGRIVPDF